MCGWGRSVGRYNQCRHFGGAYALSLSAHVPFLCFFRLWEIAGNIGDIDQGPRIAIDPSNYF